MCELFMKMVSFDIIEIRFHSRWPTRVQFAEFPEIPVIFRAIVSRRSPRPVAILCPNR